MDFHIGQEVYVEDSGFPDATISAWNYIKRHRVGVVAYIGEQPEGDPTGREIQIAVEFSDEFDGGHSCHGSCVNKHGQYFAAKHLRPLEYMDTVPNLFIEKAINVTRGGVA